MSLFASVTQSRFGGRLLAGMTGLLALNAAALGAALTWYESSRLAEASEDVAATRARAAGAVLAARLGGDPAQAGDAVRLGAFDAAAFAQRSLALELSQAAGGDVALYDLTDGGRPAVATGDLTDAELDRETLAALRRGEPASGSLRLDGADTLVRWTPVTNDAGGAVGAIAVASPGGRDLAGLLLGIVLAASVALVISVPLGARALRRNAAPLAEATEALRRISERDYRVPLAHQNRTDEIGDLSRAYELLRAALQQAETSQAELERERASRDGAEHDQARVLDEGIAAVVDAAKRGDLSRRAPEGAALGRFAAIGASVNALVATVDGFVEEVNAQAAALSKGDLRRRIGRRFDGAFADVARNLNAAADDLASTLRLAASASSANRVAARQIAEGADDLARRAERQAADLEETAAAMEEVAASVRSNADNAQAAADAVSQASGRASAGGEVAFQAVAAMERIDASSRKVTEILSLIDGIAFQTNLLALNAAVEAARAGEAGKGFAVVAAEVRTLAQQSSDAARSIKELILASNAEIDQGVKLVKQAGGALADIVANVREAERRVAEISTASREQASGVAEITKSVSDLDEGTQRNCAAAEDSARAAKALASRADELAEHFSTVKLPADHESGRRAA